MGGNALKKTETRRYQAAEYYELEREVLTKLRDAFGGRLIEAIPAYAGKESFGDMDILIESDGMTANVRDALQALFEPNEIVRNGGCYSFDVKQLQVDLILTPIKEFRTSLVYFSYNDLGNLMGRVFHAMGAKYGHEGLCYAVYDPEDPSHRIEDILVSTDHTLIFAFAGYSFQRWTQGFKNLEEVFEFAIDTPFYSFDIFDFENRNHRSRVRDRKRPTYTKFVEWAKDKPDRYNWGLYIRDGEFDRTKFLDRISEFFPDFRAKYDAAIARNEHRKFVNALLNGNRVRELTGLDGIELGYLMKYLKTDPEVLVLVEKKPRTGAVEQDFDEHVMRVYKYGDWKPENNKNKEVTNDGGSP
jgi:hypothetical protein